MRLLARYDTNRRVYWIFTEISATMPWFCLAAIVRGKVRKTDVQEAQRPKDFA
jgi:hypothetical protein